MRKWLKIVLIVLVTLGISLFLFVQIFIRGNILSGKSEQEIIIKKKNAVTENKKQLKTGYYPTIWPSEHADLYRSHAVDSGGLPKGFNKADLKLYSTNIYLPAWGYTRNKEEVFAIGGSPMLISTFTASIKNSQSTSGLTTVMNIFKDVFSSDVPYVAKINATQDKKAILNLSQGKTVNYTGGLLMHANGFLYAVSQSVLYKIEPESMNIVKSITLPTVGNSYTAYWTTYNGMQALENGEIVLKGFHLLNNANLDGYLLLVDPETLQIDIQQQVRVSSARLMIANNYLYHVNAEDNLRFKITDEGFVLDKAFTARYRNLSDKSTQASSPLYLPNINMEVFADNTAPNAQTPIRLYTKSVKDIDAKMQSANISGSNKAGFNFFMIAADVFVHNLVVHYDPLNDLVSANKIHQDGSIQLVWEVKNIKASASPAISAKSGHIYIDDYKNGKDHFIVLDLLTGNELARVPLGAALPTVGTVFIGQNNDVYILNSESGNKNGLISRIYIN